MTLKINNTDLISNFTNMNEYVQKYEHIEFDLVKMREAVEQLIKIRPFERKAPEPSIVLRAVTKPSSMLCLLEAYDLGVAIKVSWYKSVPRLVAVLFL